ncbi:MAG TPA: hypothetical protein VHX38_09730 [Pseudonocardiaceae bacterium]|nr:hypothetical protein [Pseudonocardiaceae bacterium]
MTDASASAAPHADPFGTASLRDSVLAAWRDSPTRFREDANAEEDLRLGGYRDRMLVELAQNAADAAVSAGVAGHLLLTVATTANGPELRVANTGAPLTADGVAALASLRASAKRSGEQVGQFGVGFAAVLAVTEEPRVVSTTGGVRFSATRTRASIADHDRLAALLAQRDHEVPVLRLTWPIEESDDPVPAGFDTEVRLPPRPGVDLEPLLASAAEQAPDLLLALPGLATIEVAGQRWDRVEGDKPGIIELRGPTEDTVTRWLTRRSTGTLTEAQSQRLGVEARARANWSVCWAVPLSAKGIPLPVSGEVLHAPTPTDERLSLPARLLATLPVEPSRRRLLPGPATDAVLAAAAAEYPLLVAELPVEHRTALVPLPEFPMSEVDGQLRAGVLDALSGASWLPAENGGLRAPAGSSVLDLPDPDLAALLVALLPGLLAGRLSEPEYAPALAVFDVRRLHAADLVAAISGIERAPEWWARLYAALERWVESDAAIAEELGSLPVPLIDGRMSFGPRDLLLPSPEVGELLSEVDIVGLRVADPDAVHPLLERLGARHADALDLLEAPAVRDAVANSIADAQSGVDTDNLVDTVLHLVERAALEPGELAWLGELALPDEQGGARRAGELVLPGAPLLAVLAADAIGEDAPLGVLAADLAEHWPPRVLAAVGVLATFAVLVDESPAGADHDLADEAEWWEWIEGDVSPPATLMGIRDLDLVDEDAWPAALRLLASEPATARALADPAGYSAWWLARYALLAGHPPLFWRLPTATDLIGLYDEIPDLGLPPALLATIGVQRELVISDAPDAQELTQRLGDPEREVTAGTAIRMHTELASAMAAGGFEPADVQAPARVRALSGETVDAEDAVLLDRPWFLGVLPENRVLAARVLPTRTPLGEPVEPEFDAIEALAELCNIALAGEVVTATPQTPGDPVEWSELGAIRLACSLLGVEVPAGTVIVMDELVVDGQRVDWWVVEHGEFAGDTVYAEDSAEGLARALAWVLDRWADRWLLAGLLTDPTAGTALR